MSTPREEAPEALLERIGLPRHSRPGSLEAVLALLRDQAPGRVLDLPCGSGLLAEALLRLGFRVEAADLEPDRFELHGRLPFHRADLDAPLPFAAASFDWVHCGDGVEHLENPFAALRELRRVLAPDGRLILTTPNYLSLESRLRFLFTGSLTKPIARQPHPASLSRAERGHVNPLTLTRLLWIAEAAGLRPESVRTLLPMRRQRWLAPLAACVWGVGRALGRRRRRDLYAEWSLSWDLLLGGRKLLVVLRPDGELPKP